MVLFRANACCRVVVASKLSQSETQNSPPPFQRLPGESARLEVVESVGERSKKTTKRTYDKGSSVEQDLDFDLKFRFEDVNDPRIHESDRGKQSILQKGLLENQQERNEDKYQVLHEPKSRFQTQAEAKSPLQMRRQRMYPHEDRPETTRNASNEQGFRRLEQVFYTIADVEDQSRKQEPRLLDQRLVRTSRRHHNNPRLGSTINSTATLLNLSSSSALPTPAAVLGCHISCPCSCHSQRNPVTTFLSSFRSTTGSFAFVFKSRRGSVSCNTPSCETRSQQSLHITYTFPSWLFHAAISATIKNWSMGSPELVLRVYRRVSIDFENLASSIFIPLVRNDVGAVKRMLARREASVYDITATAGTSAIMQALRNELIDIIEVLMADGAELYELDDTGRAPYQEALLKLCSATDPRFHARLAGALPIQNMIEAAELTPLHKIAMGISHGDIESCVGSSEGESSSHVNTLDSSGQTPLFYAAARGDLAVAGALLAAGASPDPVLPDPTSLSATPLSIACKAGDMDMVRLLADAGATINMRKMANNTALHDCVAVSGRRDQQLESASHGASGRWSHAGVARLLVARGADLHAESRRGSTPLDMACALNQAEVAAFLIEAGADLGHRDDEGSNALANCIVYNSFEVTRVLLDLGPERSGYRNVDDMGLTTLHYLATGASARMMEMFIESGFCGLDAEGKDKLGRTPLDILNRRSDVTDDLRETFVRCLEAMSRPETSRDHDADSDAEGDIFFEAAEHLVPARDES